MREKERYIDRHRKEKRKNFYVESTVSSLFLLDRDERTSRTKHLYNERTNCILGHVRERERY